MPWPWSDADWGSGVWGTPARSTRSQPDCSLSWSAGRPDWRASSPIRRRRTRRRCDSDRRPTTDDGTGAVVRSVTPTAWPEQVVVDAAAQEFVGRQLQRPPAFSAKHVAGERSHALARAGRAVELVPTEVSVYQVQVVEWTSARPPTGDNGRQRDLRSGAGAGLGRTPGRSGALRGAAADANRGLRRAAGAVHPEEASVGRLLTPGELLGHLPVRTLSEAEQTRRRVWAEMSCGSPARRSWRTGRAGRPIWSRSRRHGTDRWHPSGGAGAGGMTRWRGRAPERW